MKKLAIAIIVIILIWAGYYLLSDRMSGSFSGVVTRVDLDAMAYDGPALITAQGDGGESATIAVPSMGLLLCDAFERIASVGDIEVGDNVVVEGDVDEDGNIVPCNDPMHHLTVSSTIRNEVLGYGFTYRKGPDGYIMIESGESQSADFVSGIMLMNRREYEELQNSTDAREGPPAIHVRVYNNPDNLSVPVWQEQNPLESNINLALEDPREVVVGGVSGSFYIADGLYPIDTYVIANDQYVYIFMGAYLDKESDIYAEFQLLVNSIIFI